MSFINERILPFVFDSRNIPNARLPIQQVTDIEQCVVIGLRETGYQLKSNQINHINNHIKFVVKCA